MLRACGHNYILARGPLTWLCTMAVQDQLKREKEAGRIFRNFSEAPITFCPTYKVPAVSILAHGKCAVPSLC